MAGSRKFKMFTVYVLKNNKTGRHYIGSTNDLVRRLLEHNRGHTRSTRQGGNGFKKLLAGLVHR